MCEGRQPERYSSGTICALQHAFGPATLDTGKHVVGSLDDDPKMATSTSTQQSDPHGMFPSSSSVTHLSSLPALPSPVREFGFPRAILNRMLPFIATTSPITLSNVIWSWNTSTAKAICETALRRTGPARESELFDANRTRVANKKSIRKLSKTFQHAHSR